MTINSWASNVVAGGGGFKGGEGKSEAEIGLRLVRSMCRMLLEVEGGLWDAEWSRGTPVGCRVRTAARSDEDRRRIPEVRERLKSTGEGRLVSVAQSWSDDVSSILASEDGSGN